MTRDALTCTATTDAHAYTSEYVAIPTSGLPTHSNIACSVVTQSNFNLVLERIKEANVTIETLTIRALAVVTTEWVKRNLFDHAQVHIIQ